MDEPDVSEYQFSKSIELEVTKVISHSALLAVGSEFDTMKMIDL